MQYVAARDTLDRKHIGAVMADRQSEARIDPSAVDQHRACAALAAVASLLGACQIETLAQKIKQGDAGVFQLNVPTHTINGEADGEAHAGLRSMLWSKWNRTRSRRARFGREGDRHIRRHPPLRKGQENKEQEIGA